MGGKRTIKLIELLAAGGGDGDSEPEIFAARAIFASDGARVKRGIKLACQMHNG